jgi:hypothetical protein
LPSSVTRYSTLKESPGEREALLRETTEICGAAADAGCREEKISRRVASAETKALFLLIKIVYAI